MASIRQMSRIQSVPGPAPDQRPALLQDWKQSTESFTASYRFDSTGTALEFITLVGLLAEKAGIHPHVDWRIDVVILRLARNPNAETAAKQVNLARRITEDARRLNGEAMVAHQDHEATA